MRKITLTITLLLSLTKIFGQTEEPALAISHLTGDFYIYTTFNTYEESKVPANGMYLVTNTGVVLFDTPWDTTQFQPLLDSIYLKHNKKVVLCFATHWHSDKTAGLDYYRQQGIKTYTTVLTDELSKMNNKKRAEYLITSDTVFRIGKYTFETYYPGQGHTTDNIIIWFNKQKILYGGCLVKSTEDDNLGYLGDANKTEYAATIKNVQQVCKQPKYVIVGHGNWMNVKSLEHTLKMAEELKKKSQL